MANQNSITRACNMVFVPLNQLQKMVKDGYCIPLIKQGISSEAPHLTKREHQCLHYLADGLTVTAIAMEMRLSERRIWILLEALRSKFEVNTDHWLVARYYQLGFDFMRSSE